MKKKVDRSALLKKVADKLSHKKTKSYPAFKSGDNVRVFVKVREGEKVRIQPYEGIVIKVRSGGAKAAFTVRKIASGVGVERTFPLHSPVIDRIMLVSKGEVRRAKLYYMRGLRGRKGRIRSEYVYEDSSDIPQSEDKAKLSEGGEDQNLSEAKAAQA